MDTIWKIAAREIFFESRALEDSSMVSPPRRGLAPLDIPSLVKSHWGHRTRFDYPGTETFSRDQHLLEQRNWRTHRGMHDRKFRSSYTKPCNFEGWGVTLLQ